MTSAQNKMILWLLFSACLLFKDIRINIKGQTHQLFRLLKRTSYLRHNSFVHLSYKRLKAFTLMTVIIWTICTHHTSESIESILVTKLWTILVLARVMYWKQRKRTMDIVNQSSGRQPVKQRLALTWQSLWTFVSRLGAWPLPVGSQMSFIRLEAQCVLLFGLCKTDSRTKCLVVWRTGTTNSSTIPSTMPWHQTPGMQMTNRSFWKTWLFVFICYLIFERVSLQSRC